MEEKRKKRKKEKERKKKRGGKGILWGSCLYAGLFLSRSGPHSPFALSHSLTRIFRLLDPSSAFPLHSSRTLEMAIKILSATLLKNYRASPLIPRPRRPHQENPSRLRQLSTNASRSLFLFISPYRLSFLVRLGFSLRSPSSSRYCIHHSTPLQGLLFARLPVPSCSLHLSYSLPFRISRVSSYCSGSLLYPYLPSLILPVVFVLFVCLVTCFLPCLSSSICLLLFSVDSLVYLFPFTLSLPLYLAFSLSYISSLSRTNLYNLL